MKRNSGDDNGRRKRRRTESESEEEEEEVMDINPPATDRLGDVGLIEKISLRNFMCHPRLDVPLCPNVNFIVGNNGSGKSAVVTALVVGLGGKASVTNRGNKMKGFIKTGKQTAEVEIKLRNRGPDAFRPDQYGESVIVNRKFSSDGTSTYRLKSKDGKVISTKKEDLTRMLDQFNIQVDNPLAVLNQDTSRNFLHSKNAQDKYRFFLKATQLEQIKEDYDRASEHKEMTTAIINKKTMNLPDLEKQVLEWRVKYKGLTAIDDLKQKVSNLRSELAWAFVIEREKGLEPTNKEKEYERSRMPRFKEKHEEAKANLELVNQRMQKITSQLSASGEEVKVLQPRHKEAKTALDDQKKVTRNAQMEVKRLEGALKNSEKEKGVILKRIKEIQSSAKHDYEKERQERLGKIESLQERLTSLQAQETTTEHQLDQFRNAITKYKNDAYKLGQDNQVMRSQVEKQQRNLLAMEASQGNRLKRFGQFMPQLMQTIEQYTQQGKFHRKPIGPLGACFTLLDQKWSLAIECCLKSLMMSFCVHDHHDEQCLKQLVNNVCPNYRASIIITKFKNNVYDTSRKRADNSEYPSVMDMIKADNPMVYNVLIDQRTIECVLLIEEGHTARRVMNPEERPPRQAREAFTLKGDQVYSYPTFRYYSSNLAKAKYLTSNLEEDIANTRADMAEMNKKINQLKVQKTQLDSEISNNQKEERRAETQLMKIQETKRKVAMDIGELKNVEDPAPVDIATYEDEIRTLQQQISNLGAQLASKAAVLNQQEAVMKDHSNVFKDLENELKSKIDSADGVKEEVGTLMLEVETCKAAKKHYEVKLKEQEKKIKDLDDRIEKYKAGIQEDIKKAEEICEKRIKTRRTSNNLNSEISQVEKQIQNKEKQHGDRVEITRQYMEKKEAFMKIRKEIQQLKIFCENLDSALVKRHLCYEKLKKSAAFRVKLRFLLDMAVNPTLDGKMEISHSKKEIEIWVQPRKTAKSEGSRDLRSLSGGERSFSTVCFILALWDAMDSPFRCLDEFDVFMDMVNRRISMEMMMRTANSQTAKQFIFLTPQTMSNMGISSNKMRIFKMSNPERGQTTID